MKNAGKRIQERYKKLVDTLDKIKSDKELIDGTDTFVNELVKLYQNKGLLLVSGNGGSAADSQGMVTELVVKLNKNRTPIKAIALTVDSSVLTAVGNDFGYQYVFSRQIEALGEKGDIFLGITTSGNSENIIEALKMCKKKGVKSLLLTGKNGGKCLEYADFSLIVPSDNTAAIQECHLFLYHTLCELLEERLVELGICEYR